MNSRDKGSTYERGIAKILSEWAGMEVRRTPLSGGWSKDPGFNVAGDVVCSDPRFYLHCEMKKREGWYLEDLLAGVRLSGTSSLWSWWSQCTKECVEGRAPLLIFSKNRFISLGMMREADFDHYALLDVPLSPTLKFSFYLNDTEESVLIAPLPALLLSLQSPSCL